MCYSGRQTKCADVDSIKKQANRMRRETKQIRQAAREKRRHKYPD